MAASDYISVMAYVTTTVNDVEKRVPTTYLVPKSTLIEAVGAKMDVDFGALNSLLAAAGAKFDTDFAQQNGAVAGSVLDVNYTAALTSTLDVNYGTTVSDGV